jgi:DNA polymerase
MRYLVHDAETRSTVNLKAVGSHIYLCHPSTDVWCVSFTTITDGTRSPIRTWLPTDPIPDEILSAAADSDTLIVSFNDAFERELERRILHPRYGWPIFPLERRRCAQAVALSHALPGSLDGAAAALRIPIRKSKAGKAAMQKLACPRKPRKGEDPSKIYWADTPERLATLYEYNRIDVEMTAEIIAKLGFIAPDEQTVWELDASINARGIHIDRPLLEAAIKVAKASSVELNAKLTALTNGEITTPGQTVRMMRWLQTQGCLIANLKKPTVIEALARPTNLPPVVRQLLELRLDGAHAAVAKLTTLHRWRASDGRVRNVYRYHGASPGRWTSVGAQMQNLKKPTTLADIPAAIAAVRTGSLEHLKNKFDRPLEVVGNISRALVTAAPGHRLFIADLSGIESRGLAWLCNEFGKLEQWREFDRTGDPKLEPYFKFGAEELRLNDEAVARRTGKLCDLAFGYQGALDAWRRLAPAGDETPDGQVYANRKAWQRKHPSITKFWRTSVRQAANALSAPGEIFTAARITFQRRGDFLFLELPSGRQIAYPNARLYANEYGTTFTFRDASGGRWRWYHILKQRGVFGGLIAENATQGLCRDIFAAAMPRLEAAGYHIVAHLHDEFVCEVADDFGSLEEFISIITQPPSWAPDFPIAAKGRIADRFIELKAGAGDVDQVDVDDDDEDTDESEGIPSDPEDLGILSGPEAKHAPARPHKAVNGAAVSLVDIVGQPLDADNKILCPFHDDTSPSLHVYPDHFHCFSCGAHGDSVDWLVDVEGKTREEALVLLADWPAVERQRRATRPAVDDGRTLASALTLWNEAHAIAGTPAIHYLADARGIDVGVLPADVDRVLRFHPRCPFGPGKRLPCLLALLRDVATDELAGIHRIALTPDVCSGAKVERMTLGRWSAPRAVKLWPATTNLVIGEGLETVLAAATRLEHDGMPLRPAWAAISSGNLARLPVIPDVKRLTILVDNDSAGHASADRCESAWVSARRTIIRLTPERAGADFNDLVLEERTSWQR